MSSSQKTPVTIWYGERGIVNSIVTYIASQNDPAKTTSKLLDAVLWADGGKPAWISQITDVNLVVEISLSAFGNPDLLIVCSIKDEALPYCIFIEAKATCYQFSMGDNAKGMSPGFNSTINGQISLKYRFACALKSVKRDDIEIVESDSLYKAYKKELNDYNPIPRHLKKPEMLKLLTNIGLLPLDEERCYYIALTWDNEDHAFFRNADVKFPDNYPLFLDNDGECGYKTMKSRLGWLGYRNLEKSMNIRSSDEYLQACSGMFSTPEPSEDDYTRLSKSGPLPVYDKDFLDYLFGSFKDAYGKNKGFKIKNCKGSYSISINDYVLAKIKPKGEFVFVGVRISSKININGLTLPNSNVVGQFSGTYLKPDIDSVDLNLYMKDILMVFAKLAI